MPQGRLAGGRQHQCELNHSGDGGHHRRRRCGRLFGGVPPSPLPHGAYRSRARNEAGQQTGDRESEPDARQSDGDVSGGADGEDQDNQDPDGSRIHYAVRTKRPIGEKRQDDQGRPSQDQSVPDLQLVQDGAHEPVKRRTSRQQDGGGGAGHGCQSRIADCEPAEQQGQNERHFRGDAGIIAASRGPAAHSRKGPDNCRRDTEDDEPAHLQAGGSGQGSDGKGADSCRGPARLSPLAPFTLGADQKSNPERNGKPEQPLRRFRPAVEGWDPDLHRWSG